jgi:hypothetical protein
LRRSNFTPERFPDARTLEICVTTSGLVEGLGRKTTDYPMVEAPNSTVQRPNAARAALDVHASIAHEGWRRVASWPMQLQAHLHRDDM